MLPLMLLVTTCLLLAGVYFMRADGSESGKSAIRDRMHWDGHESASTRDEDRALQETESNLDAVLSRAAGRFPMLRKLELSLYRAGNPMRIGQLAAISFGLGVGGVLIGMNVLGDARLAAGFLVLGALPSFYVNFLKKRRTAAFDRQFPDALSLFTRALRAGHSLHMGMQMIADELPDPIGTEFGLAAREIAFGMAPDTAIANLQDRFGGTDLPFFVTAVLVQQETGGNLAEVLDNLGKVIRDRMQFHGKVQSLTAESRFSANILAVLPFVVAGLMALVSPEQIAPLFETPEGHMMAGVATVMSVCGWLLARQLSKVDF